MIRRPPPTASSRREVEERRTGRGYKVTSEDNEFSREEDNSTEVEGSSSEGEGKIESDVCKEVGGKGDVEKKGDGDDVFEEEGDGEYYAEEDGDQDEELKSKEEEEDEVGDDDKVVSMNDTQDEDLLDANEVTTTAESDPTNPIPMPNIPGRDVAPARDEAVPPLKNIGEAGGSNTNVRDEQPELGLLKCHHHPIKWNLHLENEDVRYQVMAAGLWRLGEIVYDHYNRSLITAFIEHWHRETCSFHFSKWEMTISLEDVVKLVGLAVKGKCLQGIGKPDSAMKKVEKVVKKDKKGKGKVVEEEDSSTKKGKGKKIIVNPEKSLPGTLKAYLLYLVGSLLFPKKTGAYISLKYLELFESLEKAGRYAWGTSTLAYLYREISSICSYEGKQFVAFTTFLEVVFNPYDDNREKGADVASISWFTGLLQCPDYVVPYLLGHCTRHLGRIQGEECDALRMRVDVFDSALQSRKELEKGDVATYNLKEKHTQNWYWAQNVAVAKLELVKLQSQLKDKDSQRDRKLLYKKRLKEVESLLDKYEFLQKEIVKILNMYKHKNVMAPSTEDKGILLIELILCIPDGPPGKFFKEFMVVYFEIRSMLANKAMKPLLKVSNTMILKSNLFKPFQQHLELEGPFKIVQHDDGNSAFHMVAAQIYANQA
ncbi:hypothetical protein GIB67_029737, partial [Kingdonia uniflora]